MPMQDHLMLSSSKLAQRLNIETTAMFQLLLELGWIERQQEQWILTAHGELEGGQYQHSDKFGRYIVWPETIIQHSALAFGGSGLLSASKIAEPLQVGAFTINALMAELGWLEKQTQGWIATALGQKLGAEQRNGQHGFFVLWPPSIIEKQELQQGLDNILGRKSMRCLDGLETANLGEQRINNFLYLHHLIRAWHYKIPNSPFISNFYLPKYKIFIDFWGFDFSTGTLKDKLDRDDFYQKNGLRFISLNDEDMQQLDSVLTKKLTAFGVTLFQN